jgi:hypothetical protein
MKRPSSGKTSRGLTLCRAGTRETIARHLFCPAHPLLRLLGLLVHPPLREGEALWLDPCGGIHTWGMRYPIDVLFLDRELRVLRVARNIRPWRMALAPRGTRSVVELPPGGAANVVEGERLVLG